MQRITIVLTATCLVAGLVGVSVSPSQARSVTPAADSPTGSLTVSAAASLSDVMPKIADAFSKRYPGTEVTFNFAGSATLVNQVIEGAPVDVLATASEQTMWSAVNAGAVARPLIFAENSMAIAMPAGNPARIRSLADLSRPGVLVGLCALSVPCGASADELLQRNGVTVTPVTRELDVRSLLAKVVSGDLDAGIVYVTDVRAVGTQASAVRIPASANVRVRYPISIVLDSPNPELARSFVTYVRFTTSAQGLLRAYGFARPW